MNDPWGHGLHAEEAPCPATSRYVFLGHAVHSAEPMAAHHPREHPVQLLALDPEYVPTGHCVHPVEPATANVPLRHTSHFVDRASTLEAVPSSHLTQSVSVWLVQAVHPGSRLYLPAEHLMHGPPAKTRIGVRVFKRFGTHGPAFETVMSANKPLKLSLGLGSRGQAVILGWIPVDEMEPDEREYAIKWFKSHWRRAKKLFDSPRYNRYITAFHGGLSKSSRFELRNLGMALICYRIKWRDEIAPYLASVYHHSL